jgi:hypothetical protein
LIKLITQFYMIFIFIFWVWVWWYGCLLNFVEFQFFSIFCHRRWPPKLQPKIQGVLTRFPTKLYPKTFFQIQSKKAHIFTSNLRLKFLG